MKRKRGRPPEELKLSENEKELIGKSLSHAKEVVDLLAACKDDPSLQKIKKALALLFTAHEEIKAVINHDDFENALTDLDDFIGICIEFAGGARETTRKLYETYIRIFGVTQDEIQEGKAFDHRRFVKTMAVRYKDKIRKSTQRVNGGPPAHCFVGLRIKEFQGGGCNG
jgi:hypothetical protein